MLRVTTVLIAVLVWLQPGVALPDSGSTPHVVANAGATAWQPSRQQAALALISFPWKQLHYEIVFLPPRRGLRAMTLEGQHRIEIYARPQDDIRLVAYDIAHELGHAIDLTYNTDETRKQWMRLRGIDPNTEWFGCNHCSDFMTPAGDFAETFAMLLRGPEYFRGLIAARPTTQQFPALRSFFPKGIFREF